MDSIKCAHCGATFKPRNSAQRFCTPACRCASQSRRRKVALADRVCERCGTTYSPVRTNQRYCSAPCAGRASYLRRRPEAESTTATCEYCEGVFDYVRKGRPRRFCSGRCRRDARNARRRQRRREERRVAQRSPRPQPTSSFPRGSLPGHLQHLAYREAKTFCAICGRSSDDEWPEWTLHSGRSSRSGEDGVYPVCPIHEGTSPRLIDEIGRRYYWPGRGTREEDLGEP